MPASISPTSLLDEDDTKSLLRFRCTMPAPTAAKQSRTYRVYAAGDPPRVPVGASHAHVAISRKTCACDHQLMPHHDFADSLQSCAWPCMAVSLFRIDQTRAALRNRLRACSASDHMLAPQQTPTGTLNKTSAVAIQCCARHHVHKSTVVECRHMLTMQQLAADVRPAAACAHARIGWASGGTASLLHHRCRCVPKLPSSCVRYGARGHGCGPPQCAAPLWIWTTYCPMG